MARHWKHFYKLSTVIGVKYALLYTVFKCFMHLNIFQNNSYENESFFDCKLHFPLT